MNRPVSLAFDREIKYTMGKPCSDNNGRYI